MKKKLLVVIMGAVMAFSLMACGGEEATETADEPAAVEETEEVEEVAAEEASDEEVFTLGDVTSDMIDFGIYAVDDDGTENVIGFFTIPDGTQYGMVMSVNTDGSADALLGSYDASGVQVLTDDDGVNWSAFTFTDMFSGEECTAVFADFDDGSVMISNLDLTYAVAGEYLSAEDTINYLGAAIAIMEQ